MTEGKIYAAMAAAMADVGAIGKDSKNQQQGFNFRGIDEVYNAVHGILAKNKIFTVPTVLKDETEERQTKSGSNLIYRKLTMQYRFYTVDGSFVDAIVLGEGMDSGDKASNKAMSIAHKYTFLQTFSIPTKEEKDPDFETHEVAPRAPAPHKPTPPSAQRPLTEPEAKQKALELSAKLQTIIAAKTAPNTATGEAGAYVVTFGKKYKGKRLSDIPVADITDFVDYLNKSPGGPSGPGAEFTSRAAAYLNELAAQAVMDEPVRVYDEQRDIPPLDMDNIPF